MAKHTPGPWTTMQGYAATRICGGAKDHGHPHVLAEVRRPVGPRATEGPANARLIAASPRLLEAARGAVAALSQNKTHPADVATAKAFLTSAIAVAEETDSG